MGGERRSICDFEQFRLSKRLDCKGELAEKLCLSGEDLLQMFEPRSYWSAPNQVDNTMYRFEGHLFELYA